MEIKKWDKGEMSKRTPERIEWSWRGRRPQSVRREVDDEVGATGSREEARQKFIIIIIILLFITKSQLLPEVQWQSADNEDDDGEGDDVVDERWLGNTGRWN